jgi:beta-mannosidase
MPGGESIRVHHAAWKARAPRDLGAGWDFEDVRDHYLRELFRVEPATLRAHDHERYLALSRIVTGEVMAATFAEWRRARSATAGALVWFLRDLWLGAGWGVLDATGTPKAAAHYLRRVLQPVFVGISDEGTNGLVAHVVNERATALAGTLVATLFRGATVVARGRHALEVAPRGAAEVPLAGLFENLFDTSYAYRFGPPSHDLVHVALEREGAPRSEAFFFPTGRPSETRADLGLTAEATHDGDALELVVRSRELAFAVRVGGDAVVAEDSYFHVAPGGERRVRLRRVGASSRCTVEAANASGSVRVTLPD